MFGPFTVWINCSSDLKHFANSLPSASNFKSFSRSLEQFFLTTPGQNNFGNKILISTSWHVKFAKLRSLTLYNLYYIGSTYTDYLNPWYSGNDHYNVSPTYLEKWPFARKFCLDKEIHFIWLTELSTIEVVFFVLAKWCKR